MTNGLASIITTLEQRKTAIERALAALGAVEGATAPTQAATKATPTTAETSGRKKRSAAVRRKMALAQKERWAKIKGEIEPPAMPEPPKAKRKISAEGLQRIIAATKKRWRLKRAADKAALTK